MRKSFWLIVLPVLLLFLISLSTTFAQGDPKPEATDEATEVAPETTEAVTQEATLEATEAATEEATPVPTEAATEVATPEPTEAATEEATPEPTEISGTITVDGSAFMTDIVNGLLSSYAELTEDQTVFEVAANGPNAAFESLCSGTLDLTMGTRFISDSEASLCETNSVEFVETLLAWQGLVVLASPQVTAGCLDVSQFDALYGIAAEGTPADVLQLDPVAEAAPLTLFSPNIDSDDYELLAAMLPSGEIRTDLTSYDDPNQLNDLLTGETAGVAVLSLHAYSQLDTSGLSVMQFRNPGNDTCYGASLENIETRNYMPNRPLMLYVNAASLQKAPVQSLLQFASSNDGARVTAANLGFTAASEVNYQRNLNNISEPITGRTFSRENAPVILTPDAIGTVNIGGSALAVNVVNSMTEIFAAQYSTTTLKKDLLGNTAGWDDLCAKTVDVLFASGTPTPEQEAACQAAGVEFHSAPLGTDALVFAVAARHEDLPACVTFEALVNAISAPPAAEGDTPPQAEGREIGRGALSWSELDPAYPDVPLVVFLPGRSSLEAAWLFYQAGAVDRLSRSDKEDNVIYDNLSAGDQGLYRAAALANLEEAGLAILRWTDIQSSEHLSDLRLLEVDGEAGCVAPTLDTIADGSYPLSLKLNVVLSQATMGDQVKGAFMWSLFDETALFGLQLQELAISNDADLRADREIVFSLIEKAVQLAAEQAAEAAAQATPEATEAATQEATAEATEAATEAP